MPPVVILVLGAGHRVSPGPSSPLAIPPGCRSLCKLMSRTGCNGRARLKFTAYQSAGWKKKSSKITIHCIMILIPLGNTPRAGKSAGSRSKRRPCGCLLHHLILFGTGEVCVPATITRVLKPEILRIASFHTYNRWRTHWGKRLLSLHP